MFLTSPLVATMVLSATLSRSLKPIAFSGYPRGHRVNTVTGCQAAPCLQPLLILTLEPERLKNRPTTPEGVTGTWEEVLQRDAQAACSFNLSAFSFLPDGQRNGCDLACQGEPRHGGLHALGQRTLIE